MSEWAGDLAERLGLAAGIEGELLPPSVQAAVLRLAREVAHGTERRNAPLAAFLCGRYVQALVGEGVAAEQALAEASDLVVGLLAGQPDGGEPAEPPTG